MDIIVKDLGTTESKSVQEVEQKLLDEHQQQLEEKQEIETPPVLDDNDTPPAPIEEPELDDDKVL